MWGALANIGSTLLGGMFGSSGQSSANAANLRIAREQMKFQERMSSTAHQRAAHDLRAAGLNRILALGKPASTPQGASATMLNEKAIMAQHLSQMALLSAQTAKTNAETASIKQNNDIAKPLQTTMQEVQKGAEKVQQQYQSSARSVRDKAVDVIGKLFDPNQNFDPKTPTRLTQFNSISWSQFKKWPYERKRPQAIKDKSNDLYYIKIDGERIYIKPDGKVN
jgi:hypothetical protein